MDERGDRPQRRGAANMLCGMCFMRFLCQGVRAAQACIQQDFCQRDYRGPEIF